MRYLSTFFLILVLTACITEPEEPAVSTEIAAESPTAPPTKEPTKEPPPATSQDLIEVVVESTAVNDQNKEIVAIEATAENDSHVADWQQSDAEAGRLPDLNGREIKIAVENHYLPFNYILLESGEAGGWDYEVWAEICGLLNCVPVFETAVWEEMLTAVAANQYDVAANGIIITPERAEVVTFSDGYTNTEQRLLARTSEHLFTTLNEFELDKSLIVGVRAKDTPYDTAAELFETERIRIFNNHTTLFDALSNHEVAGIILPVIILDRLNQDYMGVDRIRFKFASSTLTRDRLGFAFPKESDLVQPVNLALRELQETGKLDELAQKYFSDRFMLTYKEVEKMK